MKLFISLTLFLSIAVLSNAQNMQTGLGQRHVTFRTIGKDSINLNLNENYELIEDSCSQIIRRGHLNMRERKFTGAFKDVSKLNPALVVAEGTYTAEGLKDGLFVSYYLNGKLRSRGNYKDNKFDGTWETYFEDGKPSLKFEAVNDSVTILNVWDDHGKQIVENGKGTYKVNLGMVTWKGKLLNGRPDGTWHAYKTDDATETSVVEESFKKGKFQKGSTSFQQYENASRIVLISPESIVFTKAEELRMSLVACNGTGFKHVVGAQYNNGLSSFSIYISDLVKPVIAKYNISTYKNDLTLSGEVSEKGFINNLKPSDTFNESLARAIGLELRNLPALNPATVDGKPVKQQFTITFKFMEGVYSFTYRFLPVTTN